MSKFTAEQRATFETMLKDMTETYWLLVDAANNKVLCAEWVYGWSGLGLGAKFQANGNLSQYAVGSLQATKIDKLSLMAKRWAQNPPQNGNGTKATLIPRGDLIEENLKGALTTIGTIAASLYKE